MTQEKTQRHKNSHESLSAAIRAYAVSLGSVLVATSLRLALDLAVGPRVPFITYFPAVLIGAWAGGWAGGLIAVGTSALVATYLFLPPTHSLSIASYNDQVSLVTFVLVGLCLSALGDSQRRAQRKAEQAAEEAGRIAAALQFSEERLRLALDGGGMGTWHWDLATDTIDWPPQTKALFGLPPDAAIDRGLLLNLIHPEERERVNGALQTAINGGADYDEEYRALWPDGSVHWLATRGRVHRDGQGVAVSMEGVIQNIDDRKRVEGEQTAAYRREALLNQIGQIARSAPDPDEVQAAAVESLGEALGADRAYYSAYDWGRDRTWVGRDYHRADLPTLAGEFRLSDFPMGLDAYYPNGGTRVVRDLDTAEWPASVTDAVLETLRVLRGRAAISVPLSDGTALVGALTVVMADDPREWTAAEVALVEAVAVQTQAVLEASAAERREHRIATELQEALLPAIPDEVPGLHLGYYYRAALQEAGIGGDFASVFCEDKGTSYLAVGDLSGKGLAAASQIAVVTNMLRFALHNGRTLAGPVTSLNDTLADSGLLSGFATLFVGRYEAASRALTYVNCGQDAGLVRRAAGGDVLALPPTGPVLGAISGAAFTEATVTLEPGDIVALYTDGLSEAGPSRTALLTGDGVARLLAGLTGRENAAQAVSQLIAGVDAYATGIVGDDQCLLVGIVDR